MCGAKERHFSDMLAVTLGRSDKLLARLVVFTKAYEFQPIR